MHTFLNPEMTFSLIIRRLEQAISCSYPQLEDQIERKLDDGKEDSAGVELVLCAPSPLILFINGLGAVHGVTPRARTRHPRRLVNFIGEVYAGGGLFELPRDRSLTGRICNRWYQKQYGW